MSRLQRMAGLVRPHRGELIARQWEERAVCARFPGVANPTLQSLLPAQSRRSSESIAPRFLMEIIR